MRNLSLLVLLCLWAFTPLNAQVLKVAIIDFENTSGIAKYDGLGKAMSSMLISDIATNVSPRRLQLVERSQIQKILKEQNFQASSAVDKTSTVKAGKILGVKYLLLGDIYVLNDALIINARFVDAETGDIKFSKKQEGKLPAWLSLKTNIAKELAASISMPFTEPTIKDIETPVATITTFGNAIAANDAGDTAKALALLNAVAEFDPEFKYIEDLKNEIDLLKKQVKKNTEDIEKLKSSGDLVINASTTEELENNLKSDLLTKEQKFNVFLKMIIDHADLLINKNIPHSSNNYQMYFANQLDYNSLEFINIQLLEVDKLTSKNQKILLINLIREELIYILGKYERFYIYKIPEKLIIESKLIETINLFKKCLSKYQQLCHADIPLGDLCFFELFVPFKMIQNSYIEASFLGIDTVFLNSSEFQSLQNDLIDNFIKNLTDLHHVDNQITNTLVTYKNRNGINYWYWNLLLFIYFKELDKINSINKQSFTLNESVRALKYLISFESNLKYYKSLSMPLLIDKTGVRFISNLDSEEVKIGNFYWMSKNLNVDHFQNGDIISQAKTFEEWDNFLKQGKAAWCHYNFNENNAQDFGKIYNWFAIIDNRLLAPKGWHIPSILEWNILASQISGCFSKNTDSLYSCASKLRKQGAWNDNIFSEPSTNVFGFSAMPCGKITVRNRNSNLEYNFVNDQAYWWSSSWESKYSEVINKTIRYDLSSSAKIISLGKTLNIEWTYISQGMFVRCIKN